jgi:glycogen debranching enzyme
MTEAAAFTGYRLPEAFSGYDRSVSPFPVPYPTACSPQAWSTAAPLLLLRTMLGLAPRDGELRAEPDLPDQLGRVRIQRIPALGARWDVDATGRSGQVRRST